MFKFIGSVSRKSGSTGLMSLGLAAISAAAIMSVQPAGATHLKEMDVTLALDKSGVASVHEKIMLGSSPADNFERRISRRYKRGLPFMINHASRPVKISEVKVTDGAGNELPFDLNEDGYSTNILVKPENISSGKELVIDYKVDNVINFVTDTSGGDKIGTPKLYWKATNFMTDDSLDKVNVTLVLPDGINAKKVKAFSHIGLSRDMEATEFKGRGQNPVLPVQGTSTVSITGVRVTRGSEFAVKAYFPGSNMNECGWHQYTGPQWGMWATGAFAIGAFAVFKLRQ